MRVNVNKDDDALYFRLVDREICESEEIKPGVILDYDEAGEGCWSRVPGHCEKGVASGTVLNPFRIRVDALSFKLWVMGSIPVRLNDYSFL